MQRCMGLKNVLQMCRFMFPNLLIREALPIVLGTLKTMNVVVI